MTCAVAYLRVSSREQGKSGLGLEAQRATIERLASTESIHIVEWYTEVQSGSGFSDMLAKRPQLVAALNHAKRINGPIIVAKLDRLSRNVHFISGLMVEEVDFRCCDLPPEAPKFMLHIFAVLAEWERDRISERTKAALQVVKARGKKLGSPYPKRGGRVSADLRQLVSIARDRLLFEVAGTDGSPAERAARLNAAGHKTEEGNAFRGYHITRMVKRASQKP